MNRLLIALGLLLAGCADRAELTTPVRVDIPIPVPCGAGLVPEPDWPVRRLPDQASVNEILRALVVENELRKGYEIRLVAALRACR
jgi:hypothetical protein